MIIMVVRLSVFHEILNFPITLLAFNQILSTYTIHWLAPYFGDNTPSLLQRDRHHFVSVIVVGLIYPPWS